MAAGLFVVLATVTACQSTTSGAAGASSGSERAPSTALPLLPQPWLPVPPSQIDNRDRYYPATDVRVTADGRILVLPNFGGCGSTVVRVTKQTPTQVTIVLTDTQSPAQYCGRTSLPMHTTMRLDAPLNGRTIVFQED